MPFCWLCPEVARILPVLTISSGIDLILKSFDNLYCSKCLVSFN